MPGPGTRSVHGDPPDDERDGPVVTPIHRTSTFRFASTDALLENAAGAGGFYTRYGHPNFEVAERKFAALHGAEEAVLFASGMAALAGVFHAHGNAGARIVALRDLYGGTRELLERLASHEGIDVVWTDSTPDAVDESLEGAAILIGESPTNPVLRVLDVPAIAERCKAHGALFVLDATFAGPLRLQPLAHGVDLVVESATKSLGGHSDLLGGFVAGSAALTAEVRRMRKVYGGICDPETAWLLDRGLKTLAVRVRRQDETTAELARRLESDERVGRVLYPGLKSHPDHALLQRLEQEAGSILAFAVADGDARAFIDGLRLIANAPSLGGVETLACSPALTSHAGLTPAQREQAGITDDLVRLSVGLEDVDDLWSDVSRALG